MSDILKVLWGDEIVGYIEYANFGRELCFHYDHQWLGMRNIPISLSLPCTDKILPSDKSTAFFINLLPEETVYRNICVESKLDGSDYYGFLSLYGQECAGALSIVPNDLNASKKIVAYKDITNDIERLLAEKNIHPSYNLITMAQVKLSLAGAQDKLPVHLDNDRILVPAQNSYAPTTWILKPAVSSFRGLIQNETFCMELARSVDLPVPKTKIMRFGQEEAYLVSRFDRQLKNGVIHRLHQEDFCQAMGVDRNKKYQIHGGPGFAECAALLSASNLIDGTFAKETFIKGALFNYIIGNCDAHGKNFSLTHDLTGQVGLAPFYDLVSTVVYPHLDKNFAMSFGKEFNYPDVSELSFQYFSDNVGISSERMMKFMQDLASRIEKNIDNVAEYCEQQYGSSPIYDSIYGVIKKGISNFEHFTHALRNEIKKPLFDRTNSVMADIQRRPEKQTSMQQAEPDKNTEQAKSHGLTR
jgi:serine/threonine-protein kinase HipA